MWESFLPEADAVLEAVGWQPIETAPKDGTAVMVWASQYHVARWERRWSVMLRGELDAWWVAPELDVKPSHWHPLREPPTLE